MIWLALCLLFILINMNCTNSPSGAVEFNTTRYYIDGKFHEEIPEEYIFKTWGYRLKDNINKIEHTYKEPIVMSHNDRLVSFCTIHRHWEKISAFYDYKGDTYIYMISKHRKSFKR